MGTKAKGTPMSDPLAGMSGSWAPTLQKTQAEPRPNDQRRIYLPQQALKDGVCTTWRVAIRAILLGGGGEPDAAAAASGYTLFGDDVADLLTYPVAAGYIAVVDELVFRPVSDLGFEYVTIQIVDGGIAGSQTVGRRGQVVGWDIPLPVDGSGVVPVGFQAMGQTTLRLQASNADPECYQAVEAELRGRLYDASQFRGENRR